MNLSLSRCLCVLSFLGPLAVASSAVAQDIAAADALFNRGVTEMKAENYKKGCPLIAESLRVDPQPGTLFTLSQCEVKWGRIATAVVRLDEYLQLYDRLTPDQKAQQVSRLKVAKEQREKLALEVPELTLSLPPGAPAGTVVRRDDAVVASAALGLGLPVDPGEHVVSTLAPGGALWEQRFTIAGGEKKPLVLEVKTAPPVEARPAVVTPVATPEPPKQALPPVEAGAGPSKRRVAAYVIGGVGIAGLAVGGVMGGLALGKKSIIDASCGVGKNPKDPTDELFCKPDGLTAVDAVKPLGLGSTIGFAVGLAGVGTAIVMILTEPKKATPVTGARTPWISASVLSAGPGGALVGAHGSW
jgi:hypothetical protein